jgi:acetyltransferase-like isoleucine patch superfamily enzyme
MMIREIYLRFKFWFVTDRLGPDIPATHWRLYFNSTMRDFCKKKFRHFGKGAEIRPGAYAIACSKISIGSRVIIRPGTMLFADPRAGEGGTISIEDDVLLGSAVHIYVNNHYFLDSSLPIIDQGHSPPRSVSVETGAWIGAGAIILPGVSIGRNSVIGAGAIVTKDIPPFSVAVGNPARVIKTISKPSIDNAC